MALKLLILLSLNLLLKGEVSPKHSKKQLYGTSLKTQNGKIEFYVDEIFKVLRYSLAMGLNVDDVRAILWISLKTLPEGERGPFIEDILKIYRELIEGEDHSRKAKIEEESVKKNMTRGDIVKFGKSLG